MAREFEALRDDRLIMSGFPESHKSFLGLGFGVYRV